MNIDLINKVTSSAFNIFAVGSSLFVLFYILKKGLNGKIAKVLFFSAFGSVFFLAFLKSGVQYFFWRSDKFAKYFLPPYADISYFFQSSFFNFFFQALASLVFGLLMLAVFYLIGRLFKKRFLTLEDGYLFLGFSLLAGWPYFFIYVGFIFLAALAYLSYVSISKKDLKQNIGLTYLFPISYLATFVFGVYLAKILNLYIFTI
ncbi:hypothetical protein HY249_03310 [Candidatus Azambacteria bacterium]|nr:hypothetical protein [Candidatus Azambacteria bacterium]